VIVGFVVSNQELDDYFAQAQILVLKQQAMIFSWLADQSADTSYYCHF
jgi:hypothetical protein